MQQRGDFPIEKLCTFYPYTEIDKALADMHEGSVSPNYPQEHLENAKS
jgi:Zn-dependent alcohol dehydrogenase